MLGEKSIGSHIIGIDLESIFYVVLAIIYTTTDVMVSSPQPSMVDYNVLVVDLNHLLS